MILEHKTVLLESAIIQATISNQILGISSNFINIPYEDQVGNPIVITTLDATYIDKVELSSFLNALDLLGVTNPTTFTNSFDLSIISSETSQDILLSSSIMQATISQTIFDLGSSVLKVPTTNEDGVTLVKVSTGPVGHITEYIVKSEIKAMINAFTSMGFSNLSSFGSSISSTLLFDHSAEILLSSTLQATLSDQLLGVSSGTLIIPDKDSLGNNIRIVLPDVTYVSKIEIASIIDALKLLGLTDLTTFNLSPTVIFGVDFNQLLASSTMQATVSYYILENANDETALQTEMGLIVPTFFREIILANSVSQTQVEKAELISLLTSLQVLNIGDFSGTMDSTIITTMTDSDLATLLASGSMHTTIDHMLKNNSNINTMIPDLAKETIYGLTDITTKIEIRAFIEATNILAEGDFTTSSFSYTAIAALSESDRNTVLDSMIIRNIITDQLEALMASDDDAPTFDLYLPSNAEYMNSDSLTFLTKVGVNNVLLHYGLIS